MLNHCSRSSCRLLQRAAQAYQRALGTSLHAGEHLDAPTGTATPRRPAANTRAGASPFKIPAALEILVTVELTARVAFVQQAAS